jgi:hypothetical protein
MSLTMTSVPVAAATDFPAPAPPTELAVADFAAILQSSPMSGMPQLANPTALAGEVFNHLRGFVERAHYQENLKFSSLGQSGDGNRTPTSAEGGRVAELPRGQDNSALAGLLMPSSLAGPLSPQPVAGNPLSDPQNSFSDQQRKTLADFRRICDILLSSSMFSVEVAVVGGGVSQGVRSINTLLRPE